MKERAALFLNQNGNDLPIFIAGDYNSEPVSSVMSLLHSEDIELPYDPIKYPSQWQIPEGTDVGSCEYYQLTNQIYR